MIKTSDFREARNLPFEKKVGAFTMSDGAIVTGSFLNFESEYDSPDGVPCLCLRTTESAAV